MAEKIKHRLFINNTLKLNNVVELEKECSHYLGNVLRLKENDKIRVFNSLDGEFLANIVKVNKKNVSVKILSALRFPTASADIYLLFSPIKKDCMDFIIEKSVELGVKTFQPVITRYSITDKIRSERINSQIIEATEQCERLDVPLLQEPKDLQYILKNWDQDRILFFMDERGQGKSCCDMFLQFKHKKAAILIGPEGGFSSEEAELLCSQPFVVPVSLGKRILRAETAAIASIALWQALVGDWYK